MWLLWYFTKPLLHFTFEPKVVYSDIIFLPVTSHLLIKEEEIKLVIPMKCVDQ